MNLYAIASEYRAQLAELADLDLPPEAVADTVEGMAGELEDKLRAVIAYALNLRAEQEAQTAAAVRMAERAKHTGKTADGLLDYALTHMRGTGIPSVSTHEWAVKVAKKPDSVQIEDGAELPDEFMRTKVTREPDKAAIKAALLAGRAIDGATLVQGYRLAIK